MLASCLVNGKKVSYFKFGTGKKYLLLLHGWPATKEIFIETIPYITQLGYTVIAPDFPGFGQSEPLDSRNTYDSLSQVLLDFIDILKIDRLSIGGTSMGAITAIWMAAKKPEKFSNLFLNSPSFRAWDIMTFPQKLLLKTTQRIFPARKLLFWIMQNHEIAFCKLVWGLDIDKNPSIKKILEAAKHNTVKTVWEMLLDDAYNGTSLTLLKNLTMPIKFFGGDNDSVFLESSVKTALLFPNIQTKILPHASHFMPVENPKLFADQFILELPRS